MRSWVIRAAVVGVAAATSAPALACGGPAPCRVEDGSYLAVPPEGWDGETPLPVTIYFHGWQGSAAGTYANETMRRAFSDAGVLWVLPDGREKTWAHVGSPSRARDELAFMDQVRADFQAHFPIEPERILVTGFSQGGSMVWDLACYRPEAYTAFAPIAGAFWDPLPDACEGAVDLRHVHGFGDTMVPFEGRPIGPFHQGDVGLSLAILREAGQCPSASPRTESEAFGADGTLRCEIWDGCADETEIRLCTHPRGHIRPEGWVPRIHRWFSRLPASG